MPHALAPRTPAARLRAARGQLVDRGDVDAALIGPALRDSWLRSAGFGLAPAGRMPGAPHASGAQLARALERQRELVAHARPVMEFLSDQTRDSGSMFGVIVQGLGFAAVGFGPLALMVLLGIAPALLPSKRLRLAGAVAALFVAAPIALEVSRPYALGKLSSRAGRGFLDFYDVLVPFDGAAHPLMHAENEVTFSFVSLRAASKRDRLFEFP